MSTNERISNLQDIFGSETEKIEETKKNYRFSAIEPKIIAFFDILKDIIDSAAEIRCSCPAISLDLGFAALSENNCFFDLLEDGNYL